MTEEQTEVTENQETPTETEEQSGTDYVELSPEQEARFKRIYANMKENERDKNQLKNMMEQMAKDNRALYDKLKEIEKGQTEQNTESAVAELKKRKVKALEEENHAEVTEIDDQITKLRQPMPEPVEEPAPPNPSEGLTQEEHGRLLSWSAEVEEDGYTPKRPWTNPGHPLNATAAHIGMSVFEDPTWKGDFEAGLKEVDRRMQEYVVKPSRPAPSVLSGGNTEQPKPEKGAKLNNDQKAIAKAMGLSEKEYAEGLNA